MLCTQLSCPIHSTGFPRLLTGEVKCGAEGFAIKLVDGTLLQCAHNHPEGTRLPTYDSQPAIVLRLEDGSNIFLPIIVCKLLSPELEPLGFEIHILS